MGPWECSRNNKEKKKYCIPKPPLIQCDRLLGTYGGPDMEAIRVPNQVPLRSGSSVG